MAQTSYSGRASNQVSDLKDKTTEQLKQVADQGRETGERVQEVAVNFKQALDKSVEDQPMATLALAAVVGFVLGALWKS
jgi:ElaB/YqjD/DUF883 family membrane-anchored ribosome-binding protein